MKYFNTIFLVFSFSLIAKSTPHKTLYYYDGSKHEYIKDATIIINNVLLEYDSSYRAYLIPKEVYQYGEKMSLVVKHPDYQSFDLKSVVLLDNYIHAIKPQGMYYSNNGIPTPIYDRMTSKPMKGGYDCMTVVFSNQTYQTKAAAKIAWERLIQKYDLAKGYSYQEAIEQNNHDLLWGCRQEELNYTFGLKKRNNEQWTQKDALLFNQIKQENGVSLLGIAVARSKILTDRIEIYYGDKDSVAEETIKKIEQQFGLKRLKYYYDNTRYYYTTKDMIPTNNLIR